MFKLKLVKAAKARLQLPAARPLYLLVIKEAVVARRLHLQRVDLKYLAMVQFEASVSVPRVLMISDF